MMSESQEFLWLIYDSSNNVMYCDVCRKVLFFAHRGHLQVLKVCDLKRLCLSQLCAFKDRIMNVGI
jgi:hypothetical protein